MATRTGRLRRQRCSWGGRHNETHSEAGFLGGGQWNFIDFGADSSVIVGGSFNKILSTSPTAAIGGGRHNTIRTLGMSATIPGGDSLIAQCYDQVVMGRYNIPQGTTSSTHVNANDNLLILGNGVAGSRANAMTVSNAGYISANAPAPSRTGIPVPNDLRIGTTYRDNTIVAWGQVAAGASVPVGDMGVSTVTFTAPNQYLVKLQLVQQPDGSAFTPSSSNCAITASVFDAATGGPALVTVSPITPAGTFTVKTWNVGGAPAAFDFMFHVVLK